MVRTPSTRHSKPDKDPVTIELEAEAAADDAAPPAGDSVTEPAAGPAPEEDRTESSPQAETGPPRRRGGIGAMLLSALLGGTIALGGAIMLNRAGYLMPVEDGATASQLSGMEERIAGFSGEISRLDGQDQSLSGRFSELEAGLVALRTEMGSLEVPATNQELPQEWVRRLEALEKQVVQPANSGSALPEESLAGLETAVSEARDAVAMANQAASANAAALDSMRHEIDSLATRIERESARPEIAIAIAAVALKSAIDSGEPFALQLETYASVAPDSPELTALRELAQSGVPSRARIASEVEAAVNAIVAVSHRVDPDAGYVERMLASLRSLVKVRPVGMVEGATPAAIAARLEVAIAENDYERAVAEYESLPEEERKAAEAFISRVQARLEADRLIDRALASALQSAG